MARSQTRRPPAVHPRARSLRIAWRIRSVLVWLAQNATPKSWWNRRTVPGVIVVGTNSALARGLIDEFLSARSKGGLFGVKGFDRFAYARDRDDNREASLVAGAWRVDVNRGTEQAVLLDLEYFVARELEQKGGYGGIDPQLSV